MNNKLTYHCFDSVQDAQDYRHEHGTGGWIFVPEIPEEEADFYPCYQIILFPPEFTPTSIFNHPFTKGRTGKLLAN